MTDASEASASALDAGAGGRDLSPRSQRTRAALVAAATEIFGEDGFTDATISSISARAGVSHGSFYTYFDSKEAVFREVIRSINADEMAHRASEPPPATVEERLTRTNRRFFETYRRHARVLASYEELAARDAATSDLRRSTRHGYIERNAASIERWQQSSLVDAGLDAEAIAHCLGSMVERVAHMQCVFGDGCGEERLLAAISHIWTAALDLDGATPLVGVADGSQP